MITACITGAGTGIGHALALALVSRGINVIAVGRRIAPLQNLKAQHPDHIKIISADVGTSSGREIVVKACENTSHLLLVHNAGSAEPLCPLSEVTLAQFQNTMQVNVEAPLFLTQALLSHLKGGRVLNISSGAAHFVLKGTSTYCISKRALFAVYEAFKIEFSGFDIAFGSVMPGMIDTAMTQFIRKVCEQPGGMGENLNKVKDSGCMLAPEVVARFLTWLLLDVNAKRFSEKEWDIYDSSHHNDWSVGEIINPLNS